MIAMPPGNSASGIDPTLMLDAMGDVQTLYKGVNAPM